MLGIDQVDDQSGHGRDGHINEKPHRHVVGLEVNANHGSQLKVDEEQQ